MSLFSLSELMDQKKDYQKACIGIVKKRVAATIETRTEFGKQNPAGNHDTETCQQIGRNVRGNKAARFFQNENQLKMVLKLRLGASVPVIGSPSHAAFNNQVRRSR
jgi:hypothetical protein